MTSVKEKLRNAPDKAEGAYNECEDENEVEVVIAQAADESEESLKEMVKGSVRQIIRGREKKRRALKIQEPNQRKKGEKG